jgi:hypothetical protein
MHEKVKETIFVRASLESSNRVSIRNLTKETLGNETAQAIIRIFETRYLGLKIFWLICLLGCGSLCGYLIAQTLITFLSYSVYTTTTLVHEMPVVFPKVTICNSMYAVTEYAFDMIKEINKELNPEISIFNQTQMRNISFSSSENIFWTVWSVFINRINSGSFTDENRKKFAHSLDDILPACYLNGQLCTAQDFLWRWDPIYGNCFSFNSGFDSSGSRVNLKESSLPGTYFGLQLAIYVGYSDRLNLFNSGWNSFIYLSNVYGLNVIIENNTFLTNTKMSPIALNGGTINYISMQRRLTTNLPKPYSDCDIDNTKSNSFNSPYFNLVLNSSYQYSQELCVLQCYQEQAIRLCN